MFSSLSLVQVLFKYHELILLVDQGNALLHNAGRKLFLMIEKSGSFEKIFNGF